MNNNYNDNNLVNSGNDAFDNQNNTQEITPDNNVIEEQLKGILNNIDSVYNTFNLTNQKSLIDKLVEFSINIGGKGKNEEITNIVFDGQNIRMLLNNNYIKALLKDNVFIKYEPNNSGIRFFLEALYPKLVSEMLNKDATGKEKEKK